MHKKWLEQFVFAPRMACFVDDGGAAVAVGGGDPAPAADPAPATPDATPAADPVADPAIDPNDPLAGMLGDLDKLAAEDVAPAADPNAPGAPPVEFAEALSISPFVKDAAQVQQAVRAADEVWKVATGEANAASLIEGMKAANPQRYEGIINELIPYIEQVTGKKFGGEATPADPVAQLRAEIQAEKQQQVQAQQQAAYQQQVGKAAGVAQGVVSEMLKGTFAEGQDAYFLARCAEKAGIPEQQMVNELLRGNKAPLQAAIKAVRAEEVKRFKSYTDNFIKQRKNLGASVPATKNTPAAATLSKSERRPGETVAQYGTRLWNEGSTQ